MSDLIAITFDGPDDAAAAMHSVRSLEHDAGLGLEDTAIVTRDAGGKLHVKNEMSSGTETGAAVGAMLGALLFVVFPLAIVGGAVIGGLIGRAAATGIDGDFVKQVEADLPAGGSALFLLTKGGDPGLLIAAMRQYKGRVVQTSLDSEEEQALRDSLK